MLHKCKGTALHHFALSQTSTAGANPKQISSMLLPRKSFSSPCAWIGERRHRQEMVWKELCNCLVLARPAPRESRGRFQEGRQMGKRSLLMSN